MSIIPTKNDFKIIKYLSKYIWFDKKETIKNNPNKVLAYAMRYADISDYPLLLSLEQRLKDVLDNAEPGWFDEKNWIFWHTFLGLEQKNLPKRNINDTL